MRLSSEDIELLIFTMVPLFAAVGGIVALYFRLRKSRRYFASQPGKWSGQVFDSRPLIPRLADVRQDYLSALHSRPHPLFHPETLLATTKSIVRHLNYFRDTVPKENDPEQEQSTQ